MNILKIILFTLLSVIISCNEVQDITPVSKVNKPEVLVVKSDKPESYTESEINAEMLIGEPVDFKEEYHKIWVLCDPGNHGETESGLSACMYDLKEHISIITMDVDKFTFRMQKSTFEDYNLESKYVYVIAGICKSNLETCQNIIKNIDKEILLKNNDIFKFAFKRVRIVADNYTITNKNPVIEKVFINERDVSSENSIIINGDDKNIIKVKLSDDSFYGTLGDSEFIPVYYKTNFGHFSKSQTYQFYGDYNIESTELIIDDDFNTKTNKKIYILVFNLRGGTTWKVINVK